MTIKHNNKNISAEDTLVLSANEGDVVLQNGFLKLKRKNLYDESDEAEDIVLDLFDFSPKLVMLASKSELDAIAQSNDADVKKERSRHAYLVPHENSTQADPWYVEYIWVESKNAFESLGSIKADLEPLKSKLNSLESDMNTAKTDISGLKSRVGTLENNKVDKESGKSLIETSKIAKLDGIQEGANKTIVDTEIKASNNPVSNTAIKNALSNKVDKETGKGLMTDAERIKLNDIEVEANKTVVDTEIKTSDNPVSNTTIKNALADMINIIDANSPIYEITDDMVNEDKITIDTNHDVFFIYSRKNYSTSPVFTINDKICSDIINAEAFNRIINSSLYLIIETSVGDRFSVYPITGGLVSDAFKNIHIVDFIEDGNSGLVTSNAVYDAIQALSNNMELTTLDITYTNGSTDQISFYTKPKTSNGG